MRKIILIVLMIFLTVIGLPLKSHANNSSEALIWKPDPILATFEFAKNNYNHLDLTRKVKWYRWDLENHYYLSLRKPFSIRVAQEIKILDKDPKCTSVPIKVRRHLSLSEATDTTNTTSIQFFQSDVGFNKGITPQQVVARPIIYTIGPSDWKTNSLEEQDFSIPVCEESIGRPLSALIGNEITLNFRYFYSTNIDPSFIDIDPKCDEIKDNKCIFNSGIVRVFGVKFTQLSVGIDSLKSVYQETIEREKNYLQTKPCETPYLHSEQQSNSNFLRTDNKVVCESSLRNLEFLSQEITRIIREADAKVAAEGKARQEAEAKAAADKIIADVNTQAVAISAVVKSTTTKKTTITCTKGKLIKKVTAIKPKCPAGYRVKR